MLSAYLERKIAMAKTGLTIWFFGAFLLSGFIMVAGMGWFLAIFGLLLLPVMILHIIAGSRAIHRRPDLSIWVILSSAFLLVFSLLRPDADDVYSYTGYTTIMKELGYRHSRNIEISSMDFIYSIFFLAAVFAIDIYLLRRSKYKIPPVPGGEFV